MFELTSMITTVLLLPICECATLRKSKQPLATFNKSINQWSSNPELMKSRSTASHKDSNVIVTSFDMGITALAIADAITDQDKFPQLDPKLAYYHTTAWRWIIRQLSLYPDLLYKKVYEFHKVWRRRFHYEDVFVPPWLKKTLFWINATTWDKESHMTQLYNINAKREFGRNDRYPPKKFVSNESFSNSTSIFYPGHFVD